jgi:hypothetical protein
VFSKEFNPLETEKGTLWDIHLYTGCFHHNNPGLTPEAAPVNSERSEKKILDPERGAVWRRHFFERRKFERRPDADSPRLMPTLMTI